jgi:hypothetical protein
VKDKERRKIYDVSVNRVDGVTEPATGRSFLLMKSSAESTTASQKLVDSATSVIDSFTKEQVNLSKDQAESIQALAGVIGVDLKLSEQEIEKESDDEEEDDKKSSAKADDKEDEDDEKKEVKKSEDFELIDASDMEAMLRKMIGPMLHEEIQKIAKGEVDEDEDSKGEEEVKKSADDSVEYERVASNRIKGQDSFKKAKSEPSMDEGLFEDVIFE